MWKPLMKDNFVSQNITKASIRNEIKYFMKEMIQLE